MYYLAPGSRSWDYDGVALLGFIVHITGIERMVLKGVSLVGGLKGQFSWTYVGHAVCLRADDIRILPFCHLLLPLTILVRSSGEAF